MRIRPLIFVLLVAPLLAGCQAGPIGSRLFVKQDKTTYRTPQVRVEEARAVAARSSKQDTPEQQQLVNDLTQQLVAEPDPIVREAIMQSIAQFNTPMVGKVLVAGLSDGDPSVRQRSCRALGARREPTGVAPLAGVMRSDQELDVRHAATRALGQIGTPEAVQALTAALEDRDPSMQLVGIEAARQATGRDLGQDSAAYLAYLKDGAAPAVASRPTSRTGLRSWLPF